MSQHLRARFDKNKLRVLHPGISAHHTVDILRGLPEGIEWPPPVEDNGILHTLPPSPSSSLSFPVRRSDVPPFFSPGRSDNGILPTISSSTSPRSDDGILPTPPFYTRLPSTYSLRRSGSSPTRSGVPEKASSTHVPRSSPSTLGAHPLPFSSLPSPHLSPSPPHQPPMMMCKMFINNRTS